MGAFWTDAENIFEIARQASQSGSADCDWAILVGPQGDIRMLEAEGWAMPGLLSQPGAETAYRVTREGGRVCLEGRRGLESCLLRSESPAAAARQLLGRYLPSTIIYGSTPALLAEAGAAPRTEEI